MSSAVAEREAPISLFDIPGCHFDAISLKIDEWVEFETWEKIGRSLEVAEMAVQWWLGDWMNHGEERYGEKFAQVTDAHKKTGIPIGTLQNYQWVADKVKPVTRVTGISWSVHREVATLPPKEQSRILAEAAGKHRREVEKEAGKARRKLGLDPTDIAILHEPETVEWLGSLRKLLSEQEPSVPAKAIFLRGMIHAMMGVIDGQLERTVQSDCYMVREAIKELLGTDDEIYGWLQSRFYFISDPELDDTLELLETQGRIKSKEAEGRKAGQKGKMVKIYLPVANPLDDDEDFPGDAE